MMQLENVIMLMHDEVVDAESSASDKVRDLNKPAWWQLFLLYTFPYWWICAAQILLYGITEACFFLGFNLVSHTGAAVLLAPFVLAPFVVGTYLLGTREWFPGQLVLAVVVWGIMLSFCGITQGALRAGFLSAMSYPGHGQLHHYTERVPYNQR